MYCPVRSRAVTLQAFLSKEKRHGPGKLPGLEEWRRGESEANLKLIIHTTRYSTPFAEASLWSRHLGTIIMTYRRWLGSRSRAMLSMV